MNKIDAGLTLVDETPLRRIQTTEDQLRKLLRAVDGVTDMECENSPVALDPCDCSICALKAAAGDVHVFLAGL